MRTHYLLLIIALLQSPLTRTQSWAKQTLNRMSLPEKIGQLFIVTAVTNPEDPRNNRWFSHDAPGVECSYVKHLIKTYHVGGVIFLGTGTIDAQVQATREFQSLSKIPLFIAQDYEAGTGSRSQKGGFRFPCAMAQGAINNTQLIYDMAYEVGKQCAAIGVNMNFAPVVDINNNPDNPVIGFRSYGQDKEEVAQRAELFMRGLQDAGIIACAKHFPGHGDTEVDSHIGLPVIKHSFDHLKEIELYPFNELILAGVDSVMTAHLHVPALDEKTIATMSSPTIHDLLRTRMNFSGLIITDALVMRAVSDNYKPGELELTALRAGNDILLCPTDVSRAVAAIEEALVTGVLSIEELDQHVLRILQTKEKKLLNNATISPAHDYKELLHNGHACALKRKVVEESITAYNMKDINLQNATIIQVGHSPHDALARAAMEYGSTVIRLPKKCSLEDVELTINQLDLQKPVVIALFGMNRDPKTHFGISHNTIELIKQLQTKTQTVIAVFGSPYILRMFDAHVHALIAYESDPLAQEVVAEIIANKHAAQGILPVHW
ncbi:hypothetical protein Noda2021_05460 [Candidatus Dependentiae bacterium Noda2021]|nr:hypothetical protein Noda2021_05460 [Candidatus Dependentiae bacterium Noda2021]